MAVTADPRPVVLADHSVVSAPSSAEAPAGCWLVGAVGLLEACALIAGWKFAGGHLALLVAIHSVALAALAVQVLAAHRAGRDVSMPLLGLIATLGFGPVGAIGAGVIGWLTATRPEQPKLLDAWYERISLATAVDPVTRLCDDVSVGRMIDLGAAAPASYARVIEHGTLAERQIILGHIARHFHIDYLPVLRLALQSPEPVIRVQAAAVAAHVRPRIGAEFQTCLAEIRSPSLQPKLALEQLHRLEALLASGLLDEGDRKHGERTAIEVGRSALAGIRLPTIARQKSFDINAEGQRRARERLLVTSGRFADLRMLRSAERALAHRPWARVRRFGRQRPDVG